MVIFELKNKLKADISDKILEKIRDIGEQEMIRVIKSGKHIKVEKYRKKI